MSGGGGGGSPSYTGGGGEADDEFCDITEKTTLNSPNPAAISGLTAGQILLVNLQTAPVQRLEAVDNSGTTVGAITSTRVLRIIKCINAGYSYEAEVLSVSGGRVDVEVRMI